VNLPNQAMQKSRAFHIEVVAELVFVVRTRFTPPTPVLNYAFYLKNIYIYCALLTFKFSPDYITFYKRNAPNTFSLGHSSRFAGSNKISGAHHIPQSLSNS
jgi:hypothetical protein